MWEGREGKGRHKNRRWVRGCWVELSLVYVMLLSSRVCVIVFSVSKAKVGANTKNTFQANRSLMTTLFGFHALLSTSLIMRPQLNAHWGWTVWTTGIIGISHFSILFCWEENKEIKNSYLYVNGVYFDLIKMEERNIEERNWMEMWYNVFE